MIRATSFYFNLILVSISILLFYQSLQIPVKDEWLSSPQIIPLSLSVLMFSMAVGILINEWKTKQHYKVAPDSPFMFFGFLFTVFLYIFFLTMIPFSIATFAFLLISFLFFRETTIWRSLIISLGIVFIIIIVFERLFQIIFP